MQKIVLANFDKLVEIWIFKNHKLCNNDSLIMTHITKYQNMNIQIVFFLFAQKNSRLNAKPNNLAFYLLWFEYFSDMLISFNF